MKRIDYILCFILGAIALLSRIPILEKYQSHWDGPQYTIALLQYSFVQHTPAPPGYPIYIGLGKFFHFFIQDPHTAIVAVSVFASVMGAIVLYFVGLKMYHRRVGIAAAIIFLTGSTFYYFSISPHVYDLLVITIPLLAYCVYLIFVQKKQAGLFLGLIMGIYFGIRPQDIIQIGILFLLGFLSLTMKEKIKASLMFVIVTLCWFIPVGKAVGFTNYFILSNAHAQGSLMGHSIIEHAFMMLKGFLLSFGIAGGFLIYYVIKRKELKNLFVKHRRILIFYSAWIAPGFLFNLLMRSDAVGYQFAYLTALLLLISVAIWQSTRKKRFLYIFALTCIALFNLYWFFYDRDPTFTKPYRTVSYHYSELRKNDIKVGGKVNFVQQHFDPQTTLIITTDVLWRPYSYYLKDYPFVVLYRLDNNEDPYSYNKIDSVNWNMKMSIEKHFTLSIPQNIKTVVFMEDAASTWVKDQTVKNYRLPGNSTITTLSVKPGDTVLYNYHSVTIKK